MPTTNQITKACIICGETCSREANTKIHVCSEICRAQYYQNIQHRKTIDNAIVNDRLDTLGMRISKIMSLGYKVSIVKITPVMEEPCKVFVKR